MDYQSMTKEELIKQLNDLDEYMDNVVVFWGDKREFREMFKSVAANDDGGYTAEEERNAEIILNSQGAFNTFIEMVRDSFDRGGINYVLSEKISALMQEVADKYKGVG